MGCDVSPFLCSVSLVVCRLWADHLLSALWPYARSSETIMKIVWCESQITRVTRPQRDRTVIDWRLVIIGLLLYACLCYASVKIAFIRL